MPSPSDPAGPAVARGLLQRVGLACATLGASFVGGAVVGVVVLCCVVGLIVVLTLGWGAVLFVDHLTQILFLGGLAGGVTGVIVVVLARLVRRIAGDERSW